MIKIAEKVDKKSEKQFIKAELKQAKAKAKELNTGRDKVKDVSRGARGKRSGLRARHLSVLYFTTKRKTQRNTAAVRNTVVRVGEHPQI